MNIELTGRLEAFGFEPSPVLIQAIKRPRSWRMTRGLLAVGIGLGVAPVVAFVPPHFPWLIAALATGGVIAQRRFTEHYTLRKLQARCPRCESEVGSEPGRLTAERMVQCPSCQQHLIMHVDLE